MLASTVIIPAFSALTAALPASNVAARAGGPVAKPIPSTCTVSNPVLDETSFLPAPETESVLLYSAYYPAYSTNKTYMAEQCLEQCYGYGDSGQCKAAFWAQNVKTPPGYYGTPGGDLETACLMYTRALVATDFNTAPAGEGTDAFARNIAC